MSLRSSCLLLSLASCSSKSEPTPAPPPPPPVDAAVDSITEISGNDPSRFTDPDPTLRVPNKAPRNRPTRPIDIILKSSPPGASAAVDGVVVGHTPAYWYGDSDGRDHEFTFVLPGHAVGRYRFVPLQSGIVHARLDPLSDDLPDGGVGVDPITSPKQPSFTPDPTPGPIDSPRPPDTVITPGSGSAPVPPVPTPTPGSAKATGSAKPGSASSGGEFGGFPGMGPKP